MRMLRLLARRGLGPLGNWDWQWHVAWVVVARRPPAVYLDPRHVPLPVPLAQRASPRAQGRGGPTPEPRRERGAAEAERAVGAGRSRCTRNPLSPTLRGRDMSCEMNIASSISRRSYTPPAPHTGHSSQHECSILPTVLRDAAATYSRARSLREPCTVHVSGQCHV